MHFECIPDWRWQAIQRAHKEQQPLCDDFLRKVYSVINQANEDEDIIRAISLYEMPFKRDTMVSFFLAKATLKQIKKGTWVEPAVSEIFEMLFIDPNKFADKMDLRLYAQFYRDNICTEELRPLITRAVTEGPYALLHYWATGDETVRVPDDELATKMVMMAYERLSAASQTSIMEGATKEAREWGKFANQALTARNRLQVTPADTEDILLAIKEREVTTAIGEDGVGFDLSRLVH